MDKEEYLLQTSQQIHQDIMFADQKAGVFIVANMGILGALYTTNYLWPPKGSWFLDSLTVLTASVLVVSIGFFALVLYPRGVKYHENLPRGLCDLASPQRIALQPRSVFTARFCSPEDGADLDATILRDLAVLVHTRSRVNRVKYAILRWGILATFAGWTLAFFLVVTPLYRYLKADLPEANPVGKGRCSCAALVQPVPGREANGRELRASMGSSDRLISHFSMLPSFRKGRPIGNAEE